MAKKKTKEKEQKPTRILNQDEIDSLLGFDPEDAENKFTREFERMLITYILFMEMYLKIHKLDPSGLKYQTGPLELFDYDEVIGYLKREVGILHRSE